MIARFAREKLNKNYFKICFNSRPDGREFFQAEYADADLFFLVSLRGKKHFELRF